MRFSQLLRRQRAPGGSRRLHMEQLEVRYALDTTLAADFFDLRQNGSQVPLDVLANDTFGPEYTGERLITSVSYGSEGGRLAIADDRKSILYTPPADFFGTESFVYAVDGLLTAQVLVNLQSPLEFDHFEVVPDGQSRILDVLANDPFWEGYQGAKRITSVSVGSQGGTIAIRPDGMSIDYTPSEENLGKETFIYVVDDVYPAQVTIDIAKPLTSDEYDLVQHFPPKTMDVLANDPFWTGCAGERRITAVADVSEGTTVEISSGGKSLIYSVEPGATADTSFRYIVDGAYETSVQVYIYRPVVNDWFEVDQNSSDFFFNVAANDRYMDRHQVWHDVIDRVTSVTQPTSGGTVTISADGQGIFYTPAADFSGTDEFTYTADGVHEATVSVQVTRPVRDDNLSAIQDTPNRVLDVLANDFIGNGYAGAKLITSVGATKNGGGVTIRADGKAILYTPVAGYVGNDKFTYTVDGVLEATARVYVKPLAQSDSYRFAPDTNHPYSLNVLQNDLFGQGYQGPRTITSATVESGSGIVAIGAGGQLLFTPSQAGSYTLQYTVDGQYEASVSVWIASHVNGDQFVVDESSSATQLLVMQNDFVPNNYAEFPPQNYQGPRMIRSVGPSQHGGIITIAEDGKSVYYEPASDFFGTDTFTYTVDNFMSATVTVEVIRRVRDDHFRVDAADGMQSLPVLVNDLFGANYSGVGKITSVTATSNGGTATISDDGKSILYTPAAGFVGTETFTYKVDGQLTAQVSVVVDTPRADHLPQFASAEEYAQFLLEDALQRYQYLFGQQQWVYALSNYYYDLNASPTAADGRDHSETNVQVAGVDEGDIIEFDSDYVYMLNGKELVIADAWPAEELSVVSRVDIEGRPTAMFLHGDRLTVISEVGGGYNWYGLGIDDSIGATNVFIDPWLPGYQQPSSTIVTVIDVSDRTSPDIVQKTTMEGKYVDSRGVGDFVYVLVDKFDAVGAQPLIVDDDNDPQTPGRYETSEEYVARVMANIGEYVEASLPSYSSYDGDGELVRTGILNAPEDIYRPLVEDATNLISVVSFNVESDDPGLADTSAVYGTGASTIYASLDNFYVFDRDYSHEDGATTRIAKFDWDPETGGIEFAATTTVAGTIINQFSADEQGDYLRIATTVSNDNSGNWSGRSENMLFVLQEDDRVFEFVGSLQNLALNETMRSVRFLGDRAFVTTARTIDPLFAIDLTDPTRPEAVGHITLPGFTSYVHPVGENYLLTVGRNTPNGSAGPTQVSIFDVSNLADPRRIAEYTFERFSFSESEIDHHAFGYFAAHGLLAIPTRRGYYERIDVDGDGYRETRQYVEDNELAVFRVDVEASEPNERLVLVSEIAHDSPVRRSGYIGDKLYSFANDSLKVVDVTDPGVVIASVDVSPEIEPIIIVDPVVLPAPDPLPIPVVEFVSLPPVVVAPLATTDPLARAIENARNDLAARLGKPNGAPLLETVETAADAPGGGWCLVFHVGETRYMYRASDAGNVQLVDDEFEFSGGTWNAVNFVASPSPAGMAGDFNLDGVVNEADYSTWRESFGTISLVASHPADGNRDGIVDSADYTVWRANLGRIAGDYDGSGGVDSGDYAFWKANFGATSGAGLAADGNDDGRVDAADYAIWRNGFAAQTAVAPQFPLLAVSDASEPSMRETPIFAEGVDDESSNAPLARMAVEGGFHAPWSVWTSSSYAAMHAPHDASGAGAQWHGSGRGGRLLLASRQRPCEPAESIGAVSLLAVDRAMETLGHRDDEAIEDLFVALPRSKKGTRQPNAVSQTFPQPSLPKFSGQ